MKIMRLIFLFSIALSLFSCSDAGNYGAPVQEQGALTVNELVERLGSEKEFEATVAGRVQNACHGEGCWLELQSENGSLVMVTYKDKAFTLPIGIEGREVVMQGRAWVDSVSVEELKKNAEENGKTSEEIQAIVNPEYSLNFEAAGVLLKEK